MSSFMHSREEKQEGESIAETCTSASRKLLALTVASVIEMCEMNTTHS